ncbi:MAG: 4Fe-4S binding protein [Magnetococcales bacterium]|nr:4Fe-4S binding protein [Magnetococcales bacterium]
MAYRIDTPCTGCWACLPLCPNDAIRPHGTIFTIKVSHCTECDGEFDDPQCVSICPVEEAILDESGRPLNPLGSLTGIPAAVQRSARWVSGGRLSL